MSSEAFDFIIVGAGSAGGVLRPAFLLLDEPAAGLSAKEIGRLGALRLAIARAGTGVR